MKKQVFLFIALSISFLQFINAQIGSVKQLNGVLVVYDKNGYQLSSMKNSADIVGFTNSFYVIKESYMLQGYRFDDLKTFDYKCTEIKFMSIHRDDIVKMVNKRYISINHDNVTKIYNENFEEINKKK